MLRLLIAFVTIAAAGTTARAQIVNVQSLLAAEAPQGVSGSVTGSIDVRSGNTNLVALAAAPLLRWRRGDHVVLGTWRGELRRIKPTPDDEFTDLVRKSFTHVRYRYFATERWLGEAFAQHELDELRRLRRRVVAGAGPKVDLVARPTFRLAAAVAYMIELEDLDPGYADDTGGATHRASSYITALYALDDRVSAVETLYVQPRLDDAGDVRVLEEIALHVRLTQQLALALTFAVAYDSRPPEPLAPTALTVRKTDTSLTTSVTASF